MANAKMSRAGSRWLVPAFVGMALGGVGCGGTTTVPPLIGSDQGLNRSLQDWSDSFQPEAVALRDWELRGDDITLEGSRPVEFYVALALERNPEIRAAREAVAAQGEVIAQVTTLDDPEVAISFMPFSSAMLETAAGQAGTGVNFAQKFPWLGTLRARGAAAEQETRIAWARLAQTELRIMEETRVTALELAANRRVRVILEETQAALDQVVEAAQIRYRTGVATQSEVLRARLERERISDQLLDLDRVARQIQADLAGLLNASPQSQPEVIDPAPLPPDGLSEDLDGLLAVALHSRPELEEQRAGLARDQANRELARLKFRPDVTAGVNWQTISAEDALSPVANGNDVVMFTVRFNLPVRRQRLWAALAEADLRVVERLHRYDATRAETIRLVRRLIARVETVRAQIELMRDSLLPTASRAVDVGLAGYRVDRVEFAQLIDNVTQKQALELQLVRLETDLAQTLATLERTIGAALIQTDPSQLAQSLESAPLRPVEDFEAEQAPATETDREPDETAPPAALDDTELTPASWGEWRLGPAILDREPRR